jgi:hypothetical protein
MNDQFVHTSCHATHACVLFCGHAYYGALIKHFKIEER